MSFESLGLINGREGVAILVGPNGSGKSNYLLALAEELSRIKDTTVVSNTARDRFSGMRSINRMSAFNSPRAIVKRAVAQALGERSSGFFKAASVLEYCGYQSRFGFKAVPSERYKFDFEDVSLPFDVSIAINYLRGHDPANIVWVDQLDSKLGFSRGRDFSAVLRSERWLRQHDYLPQPIQVYLQRQDGPVVELHDASSGELSLISSLVFLSTSTDLEPLFLIDEPENSLHPNWQREYVQRVMTSMYYRQPHVVIATHAPLIVTGALAWSKDVVSVFQMVNGQPHRLPLSDASPTGIEEILWRAFDVVTPANHFVSERLADLVTRLGQGKVTKDFALEEVANLKRESFDADQRDFFDAVVELIGKLGQGDSGKP